MLKSGDIKFVKYNDSTAAKSPMETMTKGRVYATINGKNEVSAITCYDTNGKRKRQIDLTHPHAGSQPHTHEGYIHDENGTHKPTTEDRKMIAHVQKVWHNHVGR